MRILVINKCGRAGGGAARMGETHVEALRRAGIEVDLWTRFRAGSRAQRLSQRLALKHFLFAPLIGRGRFRGYDLIHVHDGWTALAPMDLVRLARLAPVCLTLHDCSAFTGGCLYPYDCEGFAQSQACLHCPQNVLQWIPRERMRAKRRRYPASRLFASAPSCWMASLADRAGVFAQPTRVIRLFVSDEFGPDPARQVNDPPVLLVGTTTLADPRKGGRFLPEILAAVRARVPFRLAVFGHERPAWVDRLDVPCEFLGYRSTEAALAEVYRQADAYLFPSVQDNSPLTVIEALRCGVPVFAWRTGGTPELFAEGRTGWSVPLGDTAALAARVVDHLRRPAVERRAVQAEAAAESARFNEARYVREHLEWYEACLAGAPR